MIEIFSLKKLFSDSLCGKLYYRIKSVPIIRLFFDFEYASAVWDECCIKYLTESLLTKIENKFKTETFKKKVVVLLLGFGLFLGIWTKSVQNITVYTVFLLVCFMALFPCRQLKFVVLYECILTVIFIPFLMTFAMRYIIYVETAVILFFIVRELNENLMELLLKTVVILWFCQCLVLKGDEAGIIIAVMPYSLCIFRKKGIVGYAYRIFAMLTGFYALSHYGGNALLGGGAGVLVMTILGELGLIIPILVVSPWIFRIAVRIVKHGIFSENIIKTGYFFWSQSFKGVTVDYDKIGYGNNNVFIVLFFYVTLFMFLWYVLRTSRQAITKLMKKGNKNRGMLRAGLGAIIGFSLYTFFSDTGSIDSNISVYLWSCALLKRYSSIKWKREETRGNGRKKDL